jgi:mannose-6-phosphate isomerase-like protein (cupin superfamily)
MERSPSFVSATDRTAPPSQQTPGMHREQAFADDDRWIGFVRTEPGQWSGWHHHGDNETYFYVLKGQIQVEFETGDDRVVVAGGPGDFAHVPSRRIHRERTVPGDPGEVVLVRMGQGPAVVNVDGPSG